MKKNLVLLNLVLTFFLGSSFLSTASVLTDSAMVVNNTSHKILFCIPDDYDPNNTYPLVIGIHYCGGSASEYRNALVSLTDSLGVIIACPDYFSNQVPDGDTNMFKILVDTASSIYNINSDEIFLTGMSCNGDYSLRQGLNKVYPFKGIFPWAPWVSTSSPEVFNYSSDMPVVVSIGTNDEKLTTNLQIFDSLKQHGANANLILVPGVGHTLAFKEFSNVMVRSLDYINNRSELVFGSIDDIEMLGNETKEITITIDNPLNKEYTLKVYSSHPNKIPTPEITETGTQDQYQIVLQPNNYKGTINFVVELIENEGKAICQTTFNVVLEKVVGLSENETPSLVKIYPNPVNELILIENIKTGNTIEVFDILGKRVYNTTSYTSNVKIPFAFPAGLYMVKISDGVKNETHQIIKSN
jgi:hypothetical protein